MRRRHRVNQLLHRLTKTIVQDAKQNRSAIAFEDIRHIRSSTEEATIKDRTLEARLNAWSFAEVKRQIEYKASMGGSTCSSTLKVETRGTSQLCPQCGKKITQVDRKYRHCGVQNAKDGWIGTWLRP